jgi:hypothetical protein
MKPFFQSIVTADRRHVARRIDRHRIAGAVARVELFPAAGIRRSPHHAATPETP